MTICPKCGKKFPFNRERCNAIPKCETITVPYVKPEPESEIEPESEEVAEIEEDLREDLKGQADQIHDILEDVGSLPYKELGEMLEPPVSPKRVARLVSQMVRDGVELKREGSPRKVSLA